MNLRDKVHGSAGPYPCRGTNLLKSRDSVSVNPRLDLSRRAGLTDEIRPFVSSIPERWWEGEVEWGTVEPHLQEIFL
jgi:hypothetical protein